MANITSSGDGPRLTPLGRAFVFLFIVACITGAYYLFEGKSVFQSTRSAAAAFITGGPPVEIGIAYGAEKQHWFEWAVSEFTRTSEGKHVRINLLPMGSLQAAHALLNGDQRINVWSPASAAYKDVFVQEWQLKHNDNPILREESLALSPMVFVVWDERYQAFLKKYPKMTFDTVNQALQVKGGWDEIAQHPEWGLFKFGHAHPNQSNSGLMMILLAAYSYHHKTKDLALKDVLDPGFQTWLEQLERGASGMSSSTGTLMREMVLKGPSAYDASFVYENSAIESLQNAEGRWGKLRVSYPEYNFWSENPYYIINASWSTADQRKAADAFLNFFLSEPVQKEALKYGLRPANPNIPVQSPDSPFIQYAGNGVQVAIQKACEPPNAEVLSNLLASWERAQGNR